MRSLDHPEMRRIHALGSMWLKEELSLICFLSFSIKGVNMVPEGSWITAPKEAFILGIKELPASLSPIPHTHIYFAHAYNVSKE